MVSSGIQHITVIVFLICGFPEFYQSVRIGYEVEKNVCPTVLSLDKLGYFEASPGIFILLCIAYLLLPLTVLQMHDMIWRRTQVMPSEQIL